LRGENILGLRWGPLLQEGMLPEVSFLKDTSPSVLRRRECRKGDSISSGRRKRERLGGENLPLPKKFLN